MAWLIEAIPEIIAGIILLFVGWLISKWKQTLNQRKSSAKQIFSSSDSAEFQKYASIRMYKAHRLVLIGTGLNILHRDPLSKKIMERAAEGHSKLEIYLADPFSPSIEIRLIEEELGDIKPPVGQFGLINRINALLEDWRKLDYANTISIKLFTNYPTIAFLIVDSEYFVYPYGYATVGNFSPVFILSKNKESDKNAITFLDQQYNLIKEASIDAKTVFDNYFHKSVKIERLFSFALYFIPPVNSDLYKFGSQILGYDVREEQLEKSAWHELVGNGRYFGFHLTLCDALYFYNTTEIKHVWAEVEFLLKHFRPFDLTDLRLEADLPDSKSISLAVTDPSGNLEALHHEFVHRIYRRSAASNYSLGLTPTLRDQNIQRTRLMIERYRVPYILQKFQPHFTLLSNIRPEEQKKIYRDLTQIFSQQVQDRTIRVEKLSIMSCRKPNTPWKIEREIKLG